MPINIQNYIQESNGLVDFSSDKPEIFKINPSLNHEITIKNFNIGVSKLDFSLLGNIKYWDGKEYFSNKISTGQPLSSIAIKNNSATQFELGSRQLVIIDDKGKTFSINIEFNSKSQKIHSLQNTQTLQEVRDITLLDHLSLFSNSQSIDKSVMQATNIIVDKIFYDTVSIGSESEGRPDYIVAPDELGRHLIYGRGGNDFLVGGQGQETYYFELGDGQDIIGNLTKAVNQNKVHTSDILKFGEGITANNLLMKKENSDLLIEIKNTQDSIRINSYFNNSEKDGVKIIEFFDGSVMSSEKINKTVAESNKLSLNSANSQTDLLINMMSTLINKSGISSSVDNHLPIQTQSMMTGGSNTIFSNINS